MTVPIYSLIGRLTGESLQLRIVDELSAQETVNRKGLADVTIELQIISKDVNKLISDADVASLNLARMQEAHERLGQIDDTIVSLTHRQQIADSLQYLTSSMRKQKMWLLNYRDRKDIAMSLVFNLVTQQDAANNIEIAKDMRKDSSSMNGIALLTMIFLPGTFTSVSMLLDRLHLELTALHRQYLELDYSLPSLRITLSMFHLYGGFGRP